MIWLGRKKVPVPVYPVDPRVPPIDSWPPQGIAGQIGTGPYAGSWVLVDPYRSGQSGKTESYDLILPADQLCDANGDLVMSSGSWDVARPAGEGGLIDYLTTALDITWTLDEETIDRKWS